MNQLAGALVGKHVGPVLVIGGAPCLPADLETLRHGGFDLANAVIVSGNEHAVYAGMAPDYMAVNDDVHTVLQVHQEPRMRKLAPYAKLLSRHWWGDYRHPKMLKANSGLTAVLWAGLMGANPIITAGFELYRGKTSYFHSNWKHESPSMARPDQFIAAQIKALKAALEHTPLRPVSGPLTQHWPQWRPGEQFAPRGATTLEAELLAELPAARRMCAATSESNWEGSMVPAGVEFAVTAKEAANAGNNMGFVDVTDQPLDAALQARREAAMREHARMLAMIGKVRNHPRSVRRGLYDADLMRVIRWTEEGAAPADIQKKCGLPKEQVAFLVKTMGAVYAQAG